VDHIDKIVVDSDAPIVVKWKIIIRTGDRLQGGDNLGLSLTRAGSGAPCNFPVSNFEYCYNNRADKAIAFWQSTDIEYSIYKGGKNE